MHFSASIGSIPCIEALFKSGASVDVQDNNGITPLMDACKAGHVDAVRYLLKFCDASVCVRLFRLQYPAFFVTLLVPVSLHFIAQ